MILDVICRCQGTSLNMQVTLGMSGSCGMLAVHRMSVSGVATPPKLWSLSSGKQIPASELMFHIHCSVIHEALIACDERKAWPANATSPSHIYLKWPNPPLLTHIGYLHWHTRTHISQATKKSLLDLLVTQVV